MAEKKKRAPIIIVSSGPTKEPFVTLAGAPRGADRKYISSKPLRRPERKK